MDRMQNSDYEGRYDDIDQDKLSPNMDNSEGSLNEPSIRFVGKNPEGGLEFARVSGKIYMTVYRLDRGFQIVSHVGDQNVSGSLYEEELAQFTQGVEVLAGDERKRMSDLIKEQL